MKKKKVMVYITGIGAAVTLILLCCSLGIFEKKRNTEIFHVISTSEVIDALEEKKDMIIYCGQETCSACRTFSPMLKKISLEEKKDVFYLDVDLIANQNELQKYQIQESPTLININNGKIHIYRGTMNEEEIRKAISDIDIERVKLNGISDIDMAGLAQIENEAKDFILYIGRDDCGDCKKFKPILEQYLSEHSIGIYYLNLKEYREKAKKESADQADVKVYEELKERYDIDWVPTLIHIRNGIHVSRYEFLDEEYGQLDESKKQEYEQKYITDFYQWMDRERKY